ncbi:MAG: transcription antitermination factor NusB, partial [Aristaeellaceae bacterium]
MSDEKRQEQRGEGFRGTRSAASGEKKPYRGSREGGKPFGRSAGGSKLGFRSGKPGFRSGKPGEGGERPARGEGKPSFGGEKREFHGEKKPFRGEGKPSFGGEKREFHGEKKPFRGEGKPSFGGEKREFHGEKKPFRGEGKPSFQGEKRPFHGERRPVSKDKPEQMEGLASRRMALEILRAVTENGAYASLSLDEKLHNCGLSLADRRLVARLTYDTLDNLIYLDYALNQIMAKPDTDIRLRNILRLGACQILLEDRIPESAATNTAVALCKELGMEGLAGVCNGIL